MVVAHLRGKAPRQKNIRTKAHHKRQKTGVEHMWRHGGDSQEGVPRSVPDVGERVHVDVVVMQLFGQSGAARLGKQHAQPAAEVLRAAGLTDTRAEALGFSEKNDGGVSPN